jgi:hypothetical protein
MEPNNDAIRNGRDVLEEGPRKFKIVLKIRDYDVRRDLRTRVIPLVVHERKTSLGPIWFDNEQTKNSYERFLLIVLGDLIAIESGRFDIVEDLCVDPFGRIRTNVVVANDLVQEVLLC